MNLLILNRKAREYRYTLLKSYYARFHLYFSVIKLVKTTSYTILNTPRLDKSYTPKRYKD